MLLSKRFLIGLVLSAFFLTIFLWRADFSDLWDAVQGANYLYLIPGVGMYLISLMWRDAALEDHPVADRRLSICAAVARGPGGLRVQQRPARPTG